MALLQLENVSFSYGKASCKVSIVDDLSLDIGEGEFLAITGPSGSGKSTILALLAGLKKPQTGRVLFRGTDIASYSEEEHAKYLNSSIGIVYQFFNLISALSAQDNVALPAIIGGARKDDAREKARLLLRDVGLDGKAKSKVSKLSGGQQQRVAIARAFINGPQIVLADEPTGNLDRVSTASVMKMLCQQREQRNTALVIVTHDNEVARLADSVLEL